MRKDSKKAKQIVISSIQSYHNHAENHCTNYAYVGFKQNKYYTSDRFITLDANFHRSDGKPLRGYGLEIETENQVISSQTVYAEMLEKIVFTHFPTDLFKLQRDGSLHGESSAECITQVMTREFIRNQYPAWKVMFDTYFPAIGTSCSKSGNCGMHVNMSLGLFGRTKAAQDEAIRKLLYIINHHYKFCIQLFFRNAEKITYCQRMDQYDNMEGCKNADLYNMPSSHYNACNYSHYPEGRIELRLVGGQKNFPCFRNTMESVFHLVEAVKILKWEDLDDLVKIFSGCNQYVADRICTYCLQANTISPKGAQTIKATSIRQEFL